MEKLPSMLTWKFINRMMQHIHDGMVLFNPEGDVVVINKAARFLLFGEESSSIKSIYDFPNNIREIWKRRFNFNFSKDFFEYSGIKIDIMPGFGDGMGLIIRKSLDVEQQPIENEHLLGKELQVILTSSFEGIFVTDGEGTVLRVNEKCEWLYGCSQEELIGKQVRELDQNTRNEKKMIVQTSIIYNDQGEIYRVISASKDITDIHLIQGKASRLSLLDSKNDSCGVTGSLIIRSNTMIKLIKFLQRAAKMESTILLQGESGTGKSQLAKFIHENSMRKNGPFIMINCGSIPESLIESELFGYEEGAFTGTKKNGKKGFFEKANGGTLFLDEVGELSLTMQAKLLQVLQDYTFYKVGGVEPNQVDVRIITATNKDLEKLVEQGFFREDLFYRIHVIPVTVPPLRERREDIIPMLVSSLERLNESNGAVKEFSSDILLLLTKYHWPGNIRELRNMVEWMYAVAEGEIIDQSFLSPMFFKNLNIPKPQSPIVVNDIVPLKEAIDFLEYELIKKAQTITTNTYQIADLLGVSQSTIVRKIHRTKSSTL
ncbi:sigma 54-interacting transcriptional regulator [Bacillus sp. ISL-34]|uniref:sigma 54-interacting transcriptional regulator n=1 Tax=Bacillus sp. ISL-34 TaxID=2819121 RepID=UPI001BE63B92|nr:sigma 54-interacting transcriptional regulator [Bacillus sp. ISL-34]MBT2650117.1 sigma 54-interacting transcriptional regulator [Bacillus sp. ISL-34]